MQSLVKKFCSYLKSDQKKKKKESPTYLERGGIITLELQKRGAEGMEIIDLLRLSAPWGKLSCLHFYFLVIHWSPRLAKFFLIHCNWHFKRKESNSRSQSAGQQLPPAL